MQKENLKWQTVTIGTQEWMIKNLDVAVFRNGDPIHEAKTKEEWEKAGKNKQAAWCYYENDPANGEKYGKLYNWYAVNDERGLAPDGFHIPSNYEWTLLETFLGTDSANQMKSTSGWSYKDDGLKTCPNCVSWNAEYRSKVPCETCKDTREVFTEITEHTGNGTNSSGFSGLPGGHRHGYGDFGHLGMSTCWWSSTQDPLARGIDDKEQEMLEYMTSHIDTGRAMGRSLHCDVNVNKCLTKNIFSANMNGLGEKESGLSVRCLSGNIANDSKSSSNCFVITATMGDANHPIVDEFRIYRDEKLLTNEAGKAFVNFYYKVGPLAASIISKSEILRKLSFSFFVNPIYNHLKKYRNTKKN